MSNIKSEVEFRDVRSHGFVRVAVCSPVVNRHEPELNAENHVVAVKEVYEKGAQLILFPELSLSSYLLQDLHFDRTRMEAFERALAYFLTETRTINALIFIGGPVEVQGILFNGQYACLRGKVLGVIIKETPPGYEEFKEGIWFGAAHELPRNTALVLGERVPVGSDLLFLSQFDKNLVVGGGICEDGWLAITPSSLLALHGATIDIRPNASNYTIGKPQWRRHLVEGSGSTKCVLLYSNMGDGESTGKVVFDGHCLIAENGTIIGEKQPFDYELPCIIRDVDLKFIQYERAKSNSWRINATKFRDAFPVREIWFEGQLGIEDTDVYTHFERTFEPSPFVPKDYMTIEEVHKARMFGLLGRLGFLPEHNRKMVLGLSGGKDSANVFLNLIQMIQKYGHRIGITLKDLCVVTMPGFGTSQESYSLAQRLCEAAGVHLEVRDITVACQKIFNELGHPDLINEMHDPDLDQETRRKLQLVFENAQARTRMVILHAIAQEIGGIVIGTSSSTELLNGWFTLFGDGGHNYSYNMSAAKSYIIAELLWIANVIYAQDEVMKRVIYEIVGSLASAELQPLAADGQLVQVTELENGPDMVREFISYHYFRYNRPPSTILRIALEVYGDSYSPEELYRWFYRFFERLFQNWHKIVTFKPAGVKVTAVTPATDDVMKRPDDMSPKLVLKDLEAVQAFIH